jgi:hypothetical protein
VGTPDGGPGGDPGIKAGGPAACGDSAAGEGGTAAAAPKLGRPAGGAVGRLGGGPCAVNGGGPWSVNGGGPEKPWVPVEVGGDDERGGGA